jgi:hypothetical protein
VYIENGRITTIIPVGHELCVWVPPLGLIPTFLPELCYVTLHPYGKRAVIEAKSGAYRLSGHETALASTHSATAQQIDAATSTCDIPEELLPELKMYTSYTEATAALNELVAKFGKRFRLREMPEKIDVKNLSRIQQGQCNY